jgi:hypothetical protein
VDIQLRNRDTLNPAITFGDLASISVSTTITLPAGTQPSDFLVVVFATSSSTANSITTAPGSGWLQINAAITASTSTTMQVFYCPRGNPSSLIFSNSQSGAGINQGWACGAFTGVDLTTPLEPQPAVSMTSQATGVANVSMPCILVPTRGLAVAGVADFNKGTLVGYYWTSYENAHVNQSVALCVAVAPGPLVDGGRFRCQASITNQRTVCSAFALRPSDPYVWPVYRIHGQPVAPVAGGLLMKRWHFVQAG